MNHSTKQNKAATYLSAIIQHKCPRCRTGNIFESHNPYALREGKYMKMHQHCPVCDQPTEIEVGFYYGTGYVSYALCVAFTVMFFGLWYLLFGFNIYDNRIFWCMGADIAMLVMLQPVLMRTSRVIWLSWFVGYHPNWRSEKAAAPERTNPDQGGNW